jgi:quercetin dioxygenase-like cupin family protein
MNTEDALKVMQELERAGWTKVYIWTDQPDSHYPNHSHGHDTAHVVLAGEITVTTAEGVKTYKEGERFDIAEDEVHSAKAGPAGCVYVVGEA